MDLSRHIGPEQILSNISVEDKWDLIERMISVLMDHPVCLRQSPEVRARIAPTIMDREKTMSTGLEEGLALPHGRVPGFKGFAVAIATLAEAIDYGTPDDKPVSIACMVVTSQDNPTIALRVMGVLSRLLARESARQRILEAGDPQDLYNFILMEKMDLDVSIIARDLMRTRVVSVSPETPLREVTYTMMKNRLDCIPVVDSEARVVGEITCDILFKEGVPDFFSQLQSVSFIKDFDPFENYFSAEARAHAAKVMSPDFALVEKDATIMEIVFLLSVQNHHKVYVAEQGVLRGIIERIDVLDRILNL